MADDTTKPDDKPDDSSGLGAFLKQQQAATEKYFGEAKSALEERKKITEEAIPELEALSKRELDIASKPIAMPKTPHLQPVPQAPQPKFEDPFNAFGNPLVIMASIGSLFTRTPAIAALNAGAAAMNAYHEGNQEKIELQRRNFEDKLQTVIAQNQQEMQLYNAEMQKTHISLQEKMSNMSAIAHAFQNKEVIAAMRVGNADAAFKLIDAQMSAQTTMNQQFMRYQEFRERQDALEAQRQTQNTLAQERIDAMNARKTEDKAAKAQAAQDMVAELKAGRDVTTPGGFVITAKDYKNRIEQKTPDIGTIPMHKAIDDLIKAATVYTPQGGRHGPQQTPQMIPGQPIKIPDQVMRAMGGTPKDGVTFDIGPTKYQVQGDHAVAIGPSNSANPANVKPPGPISQQESNPFAAAATQ